MSNVYSNPWSGKRQFYKGKAKKTLTAETDPSYKKYCKKKKNKNKIMSYAAWCKKERRQGGMF